MALRLVAEPDFCGETGLIHLRALQQELASAMRAQDWAKVRRLDKSCSRVVDKVIAASGDNKAELLVVLKELKKVYAWLIEECQQQATVLAM